MIKRNAPERGHVSGRVIGIGGSPVRPIGMVRRSGGVADAGRRTTGHSASRSKPRSPKGDDHERRG